jgi:hypothetical protein
MVLLVSIVLKNDGYEVSLEKGNADTVDTHSTAQHPKRRMDSNFFEVIAVSSLSILLLL